MTQYELLQAAQSVLTTLSENKVDATDVKYLELFKEYRRLKSEGHKVCYIVYYLSTAFNYSEATIYRVIKRMRRNINTE